MDHPDMALLVYGDAADLPEDPVVRELLRPGRIDCKRWDVSGGGGVG